MRFLILVPFASLAFGLSASQVWGHAGNVDPNAIHACVLPSGLVRIIAPTDDCGRNEAPIHLAAVSAPNVAQVTGPPASSFNCPTPSGNFQPIPDLAVTLETTGNPVIILFTLFINANPTGQIIMRPTVDGQPSQDQAAYAVGHDALNSGQFLSVSYSRVHPLSSGMHTIGVEVTCQAAVNIATFTSWLTVYELK